MLRNFWVGCFCLLSVFAHSAVARAEARGEHPFPAWEFPFKTVFHLDLAAILDGKTLKVKPHGQKDVVQLTLEGVDAPVIDCNGKGQGRIAKFSIEVLSLLVRASEDLVVGFESKQAVQELRGHLYGWIGGRWKSINEILLSSGAVVSSINSEYPLFAGRYRDLSFQAHLSQRGIYSPYYHAVAPLEFRVQVCGHSFHQWTGDYSKRVVVAPNQFWLIPVWERVFFPSLQSAEEAGFSQVYDSR
jgi:hypothetical protein